MDSISLKKYIFDNEKIEYVLEKIGCHNIKYHSNYYKCSNYNGDNPNAITVNNNEYINVINYTRKEFDCKSDIITLTEYNKKLSFLEALKYLHTILDLEYKQKGYIKPSKQKEDILDIFKRVSCNKTIQDVGDIIVIEEEVLHDYEPILYIDWYREGIMPKTAEKFGLAYSYNKKRIIIPMRYWMTGELLGINSRTIVKNYEEFGITKFFITPTYKKSINLFGLYENYDTIIKAGYVVVYEAEKSVLKRDSLFDSTGVALSGHSMSDEQVRILIGLNVEIIISMDKDVPIEEVRHMCDKFYGVRNVSYTHDKYGLIGEKDSIADARCNVFDYLLKYRIPYDENEHKLYLQSFKK